MSKNNNLRKQIKDIKNDVNLSETEKNIKIQQLMYNSNIVSLKPKICQHYPLKKCSKFNFSCCNSTAECVRCHNETSDHGSTLNTITCIECNIEQTPSNNCINCNILFSKSYCNICYIWTEKTIYHCDKCGICRVGDKESMFHCDKCDGCFDLSTKDIHECINISYREQSCGFCLESVHNSQNVCFKIKCGHIVHNKCLDTAFNSDIIRCPMCYMSIYKMNWSLMKNLVEAQTMPEEDILIDDIVICKPFGNMLFQVNEINNMMYSGYFKLDGIKISGYFNRESLIKPAKKIDIYCYDCQTMTTTHNHYLAIECIICSSFNTVKK